MVTALFLIDTFNIIPALGQPTQAHGTLSSSHIQESPPDFGPYEYYGFEVWLEYTITITWSSITYQNGDVRQTLTASGTVKVFDDEGLSHQIDMRQCSASLSFHDSAGDACNPVNGIPGFYDVDWDSLENMERLHHLHQVTGIYVRRTWVWNGVGAGKAIAFTNPPTVLIVNE